MLVSSFQNVLRKQQPPPQQINQFSHTCGRSAVFSYGALGSSQMFTLCRSSQPPMYPLPPSKHLSFSSPGGRVALSALGFLGTSSTWLIPLLTSGEVGGDGNLWSRAQAFNKYFLGGSVHTEVAACRLGPWMAPCSPGGAVIHPALEGSSRTCPLPNHPHRSWPWGGSEAHYLNFPRERLAQRASGWPHYSANWAPGWVCQGW